MPRPCSKDLLPSNFQTQSPLWGKLPAEIRNEIFTWALSQYEDLSRAYPEDAYWYRPGFRGPLKSSTALLRTCRLAHQEGRKVFLRGLDFAFWFDRGPPQYSGSDNFDSFMYEAYGGYPYTREITRFHFFTQLYWLEDGIYLRHLMAVDDFRPTSVTITIRYSDWWNWEVNAPLEMQRHWLVVFKGSEGLRELKVEYETLASKKEEMMRIVERNKKIPLRVRGTDGHLSAKGTELVEWRWRGPSKLGGVEWEHHGKGDTVEYVVVTDRWAWVEGPLVDGEERELNEEELEEVYFHSSDEEDEEERLEDYLDSSVEEEDEAEGTEDAGEQNEDEADDEDA